MRSLSTGNAGALVDAAAKGLVTRDIVTVFASDDSGNEVTFSFWNDYGTLLANVIDGETGAVVSRTLVGDGALLSIGDIENVNDLSIRRVRVVLSQIHETVALMVRGHRIRLARAEIHRPTFNPADRNLSDTPICHYIGQVNIGTITDGEPGAEGGIALDIISDTQELTRTNPAKRAHETQQRRDGDAQLRYASQTKQIRLPWGQKSTT